MEKVYIVDCARSPFIKANGFGKFSASDIALQVSQQIFLRQDIDYREIDEVVLGCMLPSAQEANIAKVLANRLNCINATAVSVQRNCASGLQAIDTAFLNLQRKNTLLSLVGGSEVMSRAPLIYPRVAMDNLYKAQASKNKFKKLKYYLKGRYHSITKKPEIALLQGLIDHNIAQGMGHTAEEVAYRLSVSRAAQDEYALQSQVRAANAWIENKFTREVVPIYTNDGQCFDYDDGIRSNINLEKLSKLKPVFEKLGKVTAGNSSQITDGASMLLLANESGLIRHKLEPIAEISAISWAKVPQILMGLGPVAAIDKLLASFDMSTSDIDYFEINEAFAAQVLGCINAMSEPDLARKFLGIRAANLGSVVMSKLNIDGGAISIGHPVGASGARITLHAALTMQRLNLNNAVASLCIGGGQGGAILLKKV